MFVSDHTIERPRVSAKREIEVADLPFVSLSFSYKTLISPTT